MTTPTPESVKALADLADRVENSSEDDARLDVCIFATLHPDRFDDAASAALYARPDWTLNRADWSYMREKGMLRYTASLDAAVTLIPHGWDGGLYLPVGKYRASVQLETEKHRDTWISPIAATGHSLAAACTAAALRALAHLGASHA